MVLLQGTEQPAHLFSGGVGFPIPMVWFGAVLTTRAAASQDPSAARASRYCGYAALVLPLVVLVAFGIRENWWNEFLHAHEGDQILFGLAVGAALVAIVAAWWLSREKG